MHADGRSLGAPPDLNDIAELPSDRDSPTFSLSDVRYNVAGKRVVDTGTHVAHVAHEDVWEKPRSDAGATGCVSKDIGDDLADGDLRILNPVGVEAGRRTVRLSVATRSLCPEDLRASLVRIKTLSPIESMKVQSARSTMRSPPRAFARARSGSGAVAMSISPTTETTMGRSPKVSPVIRTSVLGSFSMWYAPVGCRQDRPRS